MLYRFDGGSGKFPDASLLAGAGGSLYGTTIYGGTRGLGTVFKIDKSGSETVLHSFTGADGEYLYGSLIEDPAGNLYGTTEQGGAGGRGTVFELSASGAETTVYSFMAGPDGGQPDAGLVRDPAGNLYGTTGTGGLFIYYGTVFELDTNAKETTLHNFDGGDGAFPQASLVRDADGNLYGTTYEGGAFNWGFVFRLSAGGQEIALHSFTGGLDGAFPVASLLRDTAGRLYGTAEGGGAFGLGVVFKLSATGTETVLHSFAGPPDGDFPTAGLVRDAAGNLYGTTYYGGTSSNCPGGCGTVFKIDVTGAETVLYSFTGAPDGAHPEGGLVQDRAGNLYGTTIAGGFSSGGCPDCGTVFELSPQ